ncbi:MAG: amidohydrolase [Sphingomonadales bacterium]
MMTRTKTWLAAMLATAIASPAFALATPAQKSAAATGVDARTKMAQDMVDQVFSFAEPGFQEVKTSEYLSGILEKAGFKVERGVAGIPTAFTATWSNGPGPKIALGSDIDGLLGLSQYPGVPEMKPMVEGAPGHGEGHNSGLPMMIVAALAAKDVMEKNGITGTLMLWPGVAEELLGTKAYYVRAGLFKDVDASIFAHVGRDLGTSWGPAGNNGMVSVEYTFKGKTAHAAGQPWDGRSALDAVEIMDVAWNFRREHLPVTQRSHYVITEGGGQPNIVPEKASVWYYFRENTFKRIRELYETGNRIAAAAAMATDTSVTQRTLGYAAPNYGNKPLAEAMYANIKAVGLPTWSAADQGFAKAMQRANGVKEEPLVSKIAPLSTPDSRGVSTGGGSDDIGDIMWTVPTITIRYPSNIPNAIGHNRQSAIAMATPIAHKGVMVGAKVVAMTVLDLLTTPKIIADAKQWQKDVQFTSDSYDPLLGPNDKPAIWLNTDIMTKMRPQLEKFYYDPAKYKSYLEQLGIKYEDFANVK